MEKEKLVEKIDPVAHLGGAYRIFKVLGIFMMAEVMAWYIGADRMPVSKR